MSALRDVALPPLRIAIEPSGLTLVAIEKRGVPLFHARLSFPAGAATDPLGKEGLAQFTADLLRRGTAQRDAHGVDELIEGMGAHLGVEVTQDECAMGLTVPFELAGPALDALLEVALTATFAEDEVSLARRRTLSALQSDLDDPGTVAGRATVTLGYGRGHPYGHPAAGFSRTVQTFTREDVQAFHAGRYRRPGALLALSGSASPDALLGLCREKLAQWEGSFPAEAAHQLLRPGPPFAQAGMRGLVVHKPDSTQAQVRIVAPGRARGEPGWHAAVVANTALGGGFTSVLVDAIRVDRGLSYSVSSRLVMNRHAGLSVFSSFTKNETLRELVDVALEKMHGYARTGPSEDVLDKARTYLAGLFPFGLESHEAIAEQVADTVLDGLGLEHLSKYRNRMLSVTKDQVREAAAALSPARDGAQLIVVGDADVARKALGDLCPLEVKPLDEFA